MKVGQVEWNKRICPSKNVVSFHFNKDGQKLTHPNHLSMIILVTSNLLEF